MKKLILLLLSSTFFSLQLSGQEVLEVDINPGCNSSNPSGMTVYDGKLFFSADDGVNGNELWSWDGDTAVLEADIKSDEPTFGSSSNPSYLTEHNGKLYFSAFDFDWGVELWSWDGTMATREVNIHKNDLFSLAPIEHLGSSNPINLFSYGGRLFFSAFDGFYGRELWSWDGTIALMSDIRSGELSSDPEHFTIYKGNMIFSADDGVNGKELWSYDGTTFSLLADINATGSSNPASLCVHNETLFFSADDGLNGRELWSWDGTNATMVADINTTGSSNPEFLFSYSGKLFFVINNAIMGDQLWSWNGITTTQETSEIGIVIHSEPTIYNGLAYFQAQTPGSTMGIPAPLLGIMAFDGRGIYTVVNARTMAGPLFLTVFESRLYYSHAPDFGFAVFCEDRELYSYSSPPPFLFCSLNTCEGHPLTFTPTDTTPGNVYAWDFGDGDSSTAAMPTHTYDSAGTYNVTLSLTDTALCVTTDIMQVCIYAPPALTTSSTDPLCHGDSSGTATVTAIGGQPPYNYQWDAGAMNQTTATASGLSAGSYSVTVTDNGDCEVTDSVTITEPSPLTVSVSNGGPFCPADGLGSATATPAGGTPGYTYSWNTSPVQTASTATDLSSGTYSVIVTDANGCSATGSTNIIVHPSTPASFNVTK